MKQSCPRCGGAGVILEPSAEDTARVDPASVVKTLRLFDLYDGANWWIAAYSKSDAVRVWEEHSGCDVDDDTVEVKICSCSLSHPNVVREMVCDDDHEKKVPLLELFRAATEPCILSCTEW